MTIEREELDQLRVDFSDVASGRRLPPVHPGVILRDEFLKPMELSVYRLDRDIKVSRPRLNEIVLGRRAGQQVIGHPQQGHQARRAAGDSDHLLRH